MTPLTHHHLPTSDFCVTPPGITSDYSSLSPSTSSPVTPISHSSYETSFYQTAETSQCGVGFNLEGNALEFEHWNQPKYPTNIHHGGSAHLNPPLSSHHTGHPSGCLPTYPSGYDYSYNQPQFNSPAFSPPPPPPPQYTYRMPYNTVPRPSRLDVPRENYIIPSSQETGAWTQHTGGNLGQAYSGLMAHPNGQMLGYIQPQNDTNTHAMPVDTNSGQDYASFGYSRPSTTPESVSPTGSSPEQPPLLLHCNRCKATFKGKFQMGNLRRHTEEKHNPAKPEKSHKCSKCPKCFNRNDALKKHKWKVHRCPEARPKKRKVRDSTATILDE